ncbi:signal peptidase I [Parablautia muri]|uniref:Signal peptidase I n=1 Tax=Parablautia muri TaxID=2320879 RepID=A0A9X5GRX4_9FIRM|nr:signal peptidase I [Parablautia muri]NBJ91512.1 signal peptidase I [Parablautia muri]
MARHKGLTFYEKKKRISREMVREIFVTLFYCFAAVLLAFVIVFSIGMKISMIGVSMEPALYNGQEVLINRFVYKMLSPKRGDIIAFLPNGNPNSHYYLKRVIGLPGERVQIINGYVYINGELLAEDESYDKIADAGIAETEILLESDEYFVLGDNRNISEDSRSGNIGPIKKETIAGRAWFKMNCDEETMGLVK